MIDRFSLHSTHDFAFMTRDSLCDVIASQVLMNSAKNSLMGLLIDVAQQYSISR